MFGFFNSRTSLNESGLLKGFVDNHSHVLYGVDDGVKTIEESLEILNFLEAAGATVLEGQNRTQTCLGKHAGFAFHEAARKG